MLKFTAIFLCLYLYLLGCLCADIQQNKKNILEELLDPDLYDPQIKPGNGNISDTPTTVSISLHVLSVSQIDDLKMLFTLELYFRQEWKDERLQFDNDEDFEYIFLSDNHKIWMPDIFFPNEHKSYFHDIMEPNTFIKINSNGTVCTSARITLVSRCPMHFAKFPFDKHTCSLRIESYKWKAEEINLQWSNVLVTSSNEILSPLFSLDKYTTDGGLIRMDSGEYSTLNLNLHFSRQAKYYIVHFFIPCCMIFNVSCCASWLNPRLMTARVLIGLASLFSLAVLLLNFNQNTPKVPYTRAIDVFTGMSMSFTFFALIETIFVHLSESKESENTPEENEIADKDDVEQTEKALPKKNAMKQMKKWLYENHQSLNDIDAASRVLFPICFIIFIVIYSITCAALNET